MAYDRHVVGSALVHVMVAGLGRLRGFGGMEAGDADFVQALDGWFGRSCDGFHPWMAGKPGGIVDACDVLDSLVVSASG